MTRPTALAGGTPPTPLIAVAEPVVGLTEFDKGRDLTDKGFYSACYAPSVSLYFDQHGDVRACCHNLTAVLGNIALHSIREIWDGSRARDLRAALRERDLSHGCTVCEWQSRDGDHDGSFSRSYDGFPVQTAAPAWPTQMEFAISNNCNLQCVMCTGWNSSAIRAHREHLPPIDNPYGEEFFEHVAEFLPHLERVIMLGGEPFLSNRFMRLLEMIAELEHPPRVTVITNGTQWSDRVQRICERVPIDFQLSLDAATATTFEAIRIGADFDRVMTNLTNFTSYARRHGTTVGLAFCLMPDNAHEFIDVLELAEAHELDFVSVNDVKFPPKHSPYHLPAPDLAALIAKLDSQHERGAALARFGQVWEQQRARLRAHHQTTGADAKASVVPWTVPWDGGHGEGPARCRAELEAWSGGPVSMLRGDTSFNLSAMEGPVVDLIGSAARPVPNGVPVPLTSVLDTIGQRFGARMSPAPTGSASPNEVSFDGIVEDTVVVELRSFMFTDHGDLVVLLALSRHD